jgi:DNA-binding transcriptional LysR family regulator
MLLLGAEHLIEEGRLINLFPDWPDERFPLYAYHPSRHHVPAKTRVFLDFIVALADASHAPLTEARGSSFRA